MTNSLDISMRIFFLKGRILLLGVRNVCSHWQSRPEVIKVENEKIAKRVRRLFKKIEEIQQECPHDGRRFEKPPNPYDRSGTGGLAIVSCAICGKVLSDEC